ncbi:MAG: hypothetical protein ACD_4C00259G0002 [uncultured bacterium (gcode 4)]|uniref:Uncharacterized protein n=1 Tax=uncultured bacterium (gcode 4) TaxID=1234023 RepID=K2F5Z4_9BACT|nr:MAG: hypothetical protein ACD_4C00259G0002 [uncultured bacterium (gcode 4)]
MEKREKQWYIRWLILNSIIVIWLLIFAFNFIIPKYDEISSISAQWNTLFTDIKKIEYYWYSVNDLQTLFAKHQFTDTKNLFVDKNKLTSTLTKSPDYNGKTYNEWLNDEIWKLDFYNSEIQNNKNILWNIIPTFSDSAWSVKWVDNKITLETFINYIEENLLKKYNLQSFSSIWIDNVTFDKDKKNNIWIFKLDLDISWKNSNIKNFIKNIQESWQLKINDEWKLEWNISKNQNSLSDLSNLLITIDNLSLNDNIIDDNEDNTWNITLQFYVKWIWLEDYILIKNKIINDFNTLYSKISLDSKRCDKWTNKICNDKDWNKAISDIRSLIPQLDAIKLNLNTLKNNNINDINSEMEKLYNISVFNENINWIYQKNLQIINKFN